MSGWTHLVGALTEAAGAGSVDTDFPIGPLTTYRVGGAAAVHVHVADPGRLAPVAATLAGSGAPVLIVGRGSNLLVADGGFAGVALTLGEGFADCEIEGTRVSAGGGASLPIVARQTVAASLTGFEWAVGVPGSVGGAVRMNAGGHGSDMAAVVVSAQVCDLSSGRLCERALAELDFGYRRSAIRSDDLVVSATLELTHGDQAEGEATLSEIVTWRREHQPGGQNAGSVFTNPDGDSAGRLVDAAGCKGLRIGSAEVSSKHANFIQADAGGSADDVRALMEAVSARVLDETGVALEPETRLIGFGGPHEMEETG